MSLDRVPGDHVVVNDFRRSGDASDALAIGRALDQATARGVAVQFLPNHTYDVHQKVTLPDTEQFRLLGGANATIRATAAMTAVLEKPAGVCTFPAIQGLTIDGNRLADRCLDVLQANHLQIDGCHFKNAVDAVVDLGKNGDLVYETTFRSSKVTGIDVDIVGVTPADRALNGIRLSGSATDNHFYDLIVRNCADTCIYDRGIGNTYIMVHCFGFPESPQFQPAIQIDVHGTMSHFIGCYFDGAIVGMNVAANRCTVIGSRFYWTNPGTGTGIQVQDSTFTHCFMSNRFQINDDNSATASYDIRFLGNKSAVMFGNQTVPSITNRGVDDYTPSILQIARGNDTEVLMRWFGTNPGRITAHGSGATGYITFSQDTAGGGVQVGASSGKVGFHGTTPVSKPSVTGSRGGNAALASLLTQLAAMGLITDGTSA